MNDISFPNLRREMAAKKISQKRLAQIASLGEKAIGQKLRGEREFTRKEMLCICKFFQKSLDYLFGEKG